MWLACCTLAEIAETESVAKSVESEICSKMANLPKPNKAIVSKVINAVNKKTSHPRMGRRREVLTGLSTSIQIPGFYRLENATDCPRRSGWTRLAHIILAKKAPRIGGCGGQIFPGIAPENKWARKRVNRARVGSLRQITLTQFPQGISEIEPSLCGNTEDYLIPHFEFSRNATNCPESKGIKAIGMNRPSRSNLSG